MKIKTGKDLMQEAMNTPDVTCYKFTNDDGEVIEVEKLPDAIIFRRDNSEIYYIDDSRQKTARQILDWIFQIYYKRWMSGDLMRAYLSLVDNAFCPQSLLWRERKKGADATEEPA